MRKWMLLLPLLFLVACTDSENNPGESEMTVHAIEGIYEAQTGSGSVFTFRLNQRGTLLTGDATVQAERVGLAGGIDGDRMIIELNLNPPIFLEADIVNNSLQNGEVFDLENNRINTFAAIRQ